MIVAVDVDDTVAETLAEWIRIYNIHYSDDLKPSEVTGWNIVDFVKEECGIQIYDVLKDPSLYDGVKPVAAACKSIEAIRDLGHRVIFVTSTPSQTQGRKMWWLKNWGFIDVKYSSVSSDYIECHDKSLVRADVLIDDRPENCRDFIGKTILFDRPHNRNANGKWYDYRMTRWTGVLDILEDITIRDDMH